MTMEINCFLESKKIYKSKTIILKVLPLTRNRMGLIPLNKTERASMVKKHCNKKINNHISLPKWEKMMFDDDHEIGVWITIIINIYITIIFYKYN